MVLEHISFQDCQLEILSFQLHLYLYLIKIVYLFKMTRYILVSESTSVAEISHDDDESTN